ncbi:extracellular solute-binding protein [Paenibacillus flagellatus]|uniref:HTH gntR-type domain-containing protein n=1 Tax=Paenibacillus flagellatus TaxID=2211139 RepID=A0A2V5K5H7_9BACL|nr:extracellular solute-binding protein [Paenibacillus flagellatus]PYI54002.1 hypothetical protein DLM86_15760 [Paenibacillus flagellatus]
MRLKKKQFLYVRLAGELREKMKNGEIGPGEFLPSEHELCEQYGASRFSVRKALDQLVEEGWIVRRAGQGSKVADRSDAASVRANSLTVFATSPSFYADLGMPLIIEKFEREHPGATVRLLKLPNHAYWDYIRTLGSGEMRPDLLFVTQSQYAAIRQSEAFADLNPIVSQQSNRIYPKLLRHFTEDFAVKAAPVSFSPVVLAYDARLFREYGVPEPASGWTFDDVQHAAELLTRDTNGDGVNDLYGLSFPASVQRWPVFAMQRGRSLRAMLEQPESLRDTLGLLHRLLYRTRTALLLPRGLPHDTHPFFRGKTAMTLTTVLELAGWRSLDRAFEPSIAPLALGPHRGTMLTMNGWMVPKEAPNRRLAETFVKFSLRTDVQEAVARSAGMLSVLKSVNDDAFGRTEAERMGVHDFGLAGCTFLEEELADRRQAEALDREMSLYWLGLESPDELLARLSQAGSGRLL